MRFSYETVSAWITSNLLTLLLACPPTMQSIATKHTGLRSKTAPSSQFRIATAGCALLVHFLNRFGSCCIEARKAWRRIQPCGEK
jgi:hypothetical protein